MVKKLNTLLVPYVLWVVIATLIGIPLVMMANHLSGQPLLTRTAFESGSIWHWLDQMFGVVREGPRHLGVLWYVRALFIVFIFAPLWRFLARKSLAWLFVPIWFLLWRFQIDVHVGLFNLGMSLASFFLLGIAIAVYLPTRYKRPGSAPYSFPAWVSLSFWIYCTHNLFLGSILAVGHYMLGKSNAAIAFLTPFAFSLALAGAIISGCVLRRRLPKVFALLNGGR